MHRNKIYRDEISFDAESDAEGLSLAEQIRKSLGQDCRVSGIVSDNKFYRITEEVYHINGATAVLYLEEKYQRCTRLADPVFSRLSVKIASDTAQDGLARKIKKLAKIKNGRT